jgi:hypothetical protein
MTTINCKFFNTPLLESFIERYQFWADHLHSYHPGSRTIPQITSNPDLPAIGCHMSTAVPSIMYDPGKVVFIDNLTETINYKRFFRHYPTDKHYVIFSNGHWDKDYYALPFSYTQVNYRYFLFDMADTFLSDNRFSFYLDKTYKFDYPKELNFIATAGSKRPEKDGFVHELMKKIAYRNFIFRYNGEDLGMSYVDPLLDQLPMGYAANQCLPGLEKYFHSISQTLPIDLYNLGYFNLLLEGDISWECQFNLTEKTVKTLISGMPFVMVSSPFFLKELKKLGFETYSSLWDESYDNIVDYDLRMSRLVELCNQLVTFDWAANVEQLKLIAIKNRANFFNLNTLANQHFESLTRAIETMPVDISNYCIG